MVVGSAKKTISQSRIHLRNETKQSNKANKVSMEWGVKLALSTLPYKLSFSNTFMKSLKWR